MPTRTKACAAGAICIGVAASGACGQSAWFTGLGDLPGGDDWSMARGISADGSTVVGFSRSGSGLEAFRWRLDIGMQGLGDLPGGAFESLAFGVSGDGSVVSGYSASDLASAEPFRWTESGGFERIGLPPGSEAAYNVIISADATTLAMPAFVDNNLPGFRWHSGGYELLDDLPGGLDFGWTAGISNNGSVIAGASDSSDGVFAARWDAAGNIESLGDLPGGDEFSEAYGVSGNGRVIVGSSSSGVKDEAFLWTAAEGMIGLGLLPIQGNTAAFDASFNGSVIVGGGTTDAEFTEAWIWTEAEGMRRLEDVLVNDYGLDLTGWHLFGARAISDDGLTIAGTGINAGGVFEAWAAHVPSPAGVALLLPALALQRRRR